MLPGNVFKHSEFNTYQQFEKVYQRSDEKLIRIKKREFSRQKSLTAMLTKIFDISTRSLAVYRRALEVTSHNIANASNPFFSRQRIIFETDSGDPGAGNVWGNGVKISDIRRVRDSLIDSHLISTNPNYSDSFKQSQLIGDIEKIFSEPSDLGISNLMTSFFNSFNKLSVTPNSTPLRTDVLNAANNLAAKVNSINQSLTVLKMK